MNYLPIRDADGEIYIHRWAVLQSRWLSFYVHKIVRSDTRGDYHNHPWAFLSLVLWGGYVEYRPRGDRVLTRTTRPGSIVWRRVRDYHRFELRVGQPCWTLFACGPIQVESTFLTPAGPVPWLEYMAGECRRTPGAFHDGR